MKTIEEPDSRVKISLIGSDWVCELLYLTTRVKEFIVRSASPMFSNSKLALKLSSSFGGHLSEPVIKMLNSCFRLNEPVGARSVDLSESVELGVGVSVGVGDAVGVAVGVSVGVGDVVGVPVGVAVFVGVGTRDVTEKLISEPKVYQPVSS